MTELAWADVPVIEEVEVSAKAKRRRFSAKEKLRILKLADACTQVGDLGAMLRREGIYSSSLASWRRALLDLEALARVVDLGALGPLGGEQGQPLGGVLFLFERAQHLLADRTGCADHCDL